MKSIKVKNYTVIDARDEEQVFGTIDQLVDYLGTFHFKYHVDIFVIRKEMLLNDFFNREDCPGKLLERCRNYNVRLIITGDFTANKTIQDFIYSCNNGKDLFLVNNLEQGLSLLNGVLK